MSDPKGFIKVERKETQYRSVTERIKDYNDVTVLRTEKESREQARRCMDCGVPFCHWGCPVGNVIPEWNELMFHGNWKRAYELLSSTNNLPEVTGRICPATCEYACVLGINDDPVTIRENELAIIEYAFENGLVKPNPPKKRTSKKIAVVGSGPAGIACADELNKSGHKVIVFEKDDKPGGIMRYGIPDFKLEKWILDRRIDILKKEGIEFKTGINVGVDYSVKKLQKEFDAICLTGGSRTPRDLKIKGRDLNGIYFAMDYLTLSNKKISGLDIPIISAKDKKVIVIGGGDTGSDCVGTANRQGASSITQIELLSQPPECRTEDFPWPNYPMILKTSSSHKEGAERHWSLLTKEFIGKDDQVKQLKCVKLDWSTKDEKACPIMKEIPDSEFEIEADLIILAVGFVHPEHEGLITQLGVKLDKRGNVETDDTSQTSIPKIFSAGDMHRGQSLIVWAIAEGRSAAHSIDKFLY